MNEFKCVDWSYPTSTNAVRFKRAQVGCWTVSIHKQLPSGDFTVPRAVAAFDTRLEAVEFAQNLPAAWSAAFAYIHPEEAI